MSTQKAQQVHSSPVYSESVYDVSSIYSGRTIYGRNTFGQSSIFTLSRQTTIEQNTDNAPSRESTLLDKSPRMHIGNALKTISRAWTASGIKVPPVVPATNPVLRHSSSFESTTSTLDAVSPSSPTSTRGDGYHKSCSLVLSLVEDRDQRKLIAGLKELEAQIMVNFLNTVLDNQDFQSVQQRILILDTLVSLARNAQVFPDILRLNGVTCDLDPDSLLHSGAYGDIYKGAHDGQSVCVKAIHRRPTETHDRESLLRVHAKETIISAHILHQNILPFYGVYFPGEGSRRFCIITPWMDNGDLSHFLKKAPKTPRLPIISDIITGLDYLHEAGIIHSDLKAKNVLISSEGRALLADFGASRICCAAISEGSVGEVNWMAPELLLGCDETATQKSDIWSFACTCQEILSGMKPFAEYASNYLFMDALKQRRVNPRLRSNMDMIDKRVEGMIWKCWNYEARERPTASDICRVFSMISLKDHRPQSTVPQKSRARSDDIVIDGNAVYEILQRVERTTS